MAQASHRILVVDDHPDVREVTAYQLAGFGFVVEAAASVGEALRLAAAKDFTAVLSDVNMPEGGGAALVAAVRALRPGLPVVLMTGSPLVDPALVRRVDGLFLKPIDFTALAQHLKMLIRSGRA